MDGQKGRNGSRYLIPAIQDLFHVFAPRIGDDATIAQGAWAEFHSALEPADNFPVCNLVDDAGDQFANPRGRMRMIETARCADLEPDV